MNPINAVVEPEARVATISNARNNNFNFLRLLFAALVIVSHAPEIRDGNRNHELLMRIFGTISFGDLAVNGFFLLSGYLIVSSWIRQPNLRDFLEKRVRRIVPGFLVAFVVSVFVLAPFGAQDVAAYFSGLNYPLLIKVALQLRRPEVPDIFVGRPYPTINGAMWSISYEFRCYLLVLVIGLLGSKRQKGIWLTLLLASTGLQLIPDYVGRIHFPGIWPLIGNPVEFVRLLVFFCAGACFHLFRTAIPIAGKWAFLATLVVLAALFVPVLAVPVLASAGAYALFWFAFARVPALAGFQKIDDVSYGLYLYGWPIQKLLDWYLPHTSLWLLVPLALALSGTAGYVSWHLVEAPWLRHTRRHTA
ncbi:acyltransferase family protein [Hymenobacter rubidus]|uniref:acyltransferase family protein n=1 Tax=Hymenobacter rubidus TaxID=1441626 RepID=UPI00191E0518|nr:acyltransferase [Hymenobacter rubidus]